MRFRVAPLLILTAHACCLGAPAEDAASLVQNPSFEDGGATIQGVGYVRQGNPIPGWEAGADGECARNPLGAAFFDNGATPDGAMIAVLQNRSTLRQEIGPFERDRVYRLRLRANGRAADETVSGKHGLLEVRLNDTQLIGPVEVKPVEPAGRHETEFREFEAVFYTGGGKFSLELAQTHPTDGISVLVDDIRIETDPAPLTAAVRVNRARVRPASLPLPGVDFRQTQWIWSPEDASPLEKAPPGVRYFRRTFDVEDPAKVKRAFLVASADNRAEVFVNGADCGTAAGFGQWYEMDFGECLRPGHNVVAVEAWNAGETPNPAGFACLALLLDQGDKPLLILPTNSEWRCARGPTEGWQDPATPDASWQAAAALGAVGCMPWGNFGFLTWLVPADFPEFQVPGQEKYMELVRQLFWLHYPGAGPKGTLWDGWLPMSSLWPAAGEEPGIETHRASWRGALLHRRIDHEGYVSTHQHHGFGHGEGWPFPTCFQAEGVGWQFATAHNAYRVGATRDVSQWGLTGLQSAGLDEVAGWSLRVTADTAQLVTPSLDIDSFVAPFVRLEWQPEFPKAAEATLEWATAKAPQFSADRSLPLGLEPDVQGGGYTHVPLYRHPEWTGRLTRLRFTFHNARAGTFRLLGLLTAVDTRHPVNNTCYLQGCTEYFDWTGDLSFLRENLSRMRAALAFALREFAVEENGCVRVPWVGHEGTAGWSRDADGGKVLHYGRGVGANYWDLLPFSGKDCLATIYLYDALRRMSRLEQNIAAHPDWALAAPDAGLSSHRLQQLADSVRERASRLFWNADTGRFVACVDADGAAHDYGYTFVNAEAVYYGFASSAQAKSIVDWLDGRRLVEGDTSVGDDLYHFRFGPRASTRRNTEWYSFVWQNPEDIAWGGQVQDGGAVLGFAFHDQMARLRAAGPDNAWKALRRTLDWFDDVRAAGGYRAYYAVPGRGTLQGGGPPGGLGMDCEFFESVLVPQVMLYGFLGFQTDPAGFGLAPQLPTEWPELRVNQIHFRDVVLEITVTNASAQLVSHGDHDLRVRLTVPAGWTVKGRTTRKGTASAGADVSAEVLLGRDRTLALVKQG